MNWEYNISKDEGDSLQAMLRNSDNSAETLACILEKIQSCCKKVVELMEGAGDRHASDFDELNLTIDGEPELCRAGDVATIKGWGFDSFQELVDSRLQDFYDYCDSSRVWVGIG